MAGVLLIVAAAPVEPGEAAVMSRAVILFLIIVCGLTALLLAIIALNRSRRLRRNALAEDRKRQLDPRDPWKESAKRLPTEGGAEADPDHGRTA